MQQGIIVLHPKGNYGTCLKSRKESIDSDLPIKNGGIFFSFFGPSAPTPFENF